MGDESSIPSLTTDQIRETAHKWTLAGDVGLLGHLQTFSQDIIRRAEAADALISNLSDEVDATSTTFSNVSNQFLSLQNSQFIENRVYEDDSPLDDNKTKLHRTEDHVESQQVTLGRYREAVTSGLSLLDSHFDCVEISESSDDEEEATACNPTLVYRPKTVYTKPLPLLIGSAEWWTDDNVGLGEYKENDDSERMSASESGSETQHKEHSPQKRIRMSSSSSASSGDALQPKKLSLPANVAVQKPPRPDPKFVSPTQNIFEETGRLFQPSRDLFDDEEDENGADNTPPPRAVTNKNSVDKNIDGAKKDHAKAIIDELKPKQVIPRATNDFTRELASKLGSKTQNSLSSQEAGNTKPNAQDKPVDSQAKRKVFTGGLFDDEIGDGDYLFRGTSNDSSKKTVSDKSSGKLFDESTSPSIIQNSASSIENGPSNAKSKGNLIINFSSRSEIQPHVGLFHDGPPPIQKTQGKPGLFDEDDEEDDLFGQPFKSTLGRSRGLFDTVDIFSDDVDDDLFSTKTPQAAPKMTSAVPPFKEQPRVSTPPLRPSVQFVTPSNELEKTNPALARVKSSSTPAASNNSPQSDMSCSISDLQDTPSLSEIQEESCDRGFIEDSSESERMTSDLGNDSTNSKNTSGTWFRPELSSTGKVSETTGYNTASASNAPGASPIDPLMPSTIQEASEDADLFGRKSQSKSSANSLKQKTTADSEDLFSSHGRSSLPPQPLPRNGRISQSTSATSRENTEPSLFSSEDTDLFTKIPKAVNNVEQSQPPPMMGRSQGVRVPLLANNDEDDLFATSSTQSKSRPETKTGASLGTENEDLFGPPKSSTVVHNKSAISKLGKTGSIFDDYGDEDDALFHGSTAKKEDTVSVSSSRSSVFEEGKSNLPGIFSREAPSKTQSKVPSIFDDIDDDCDLFSQGSMKNDEDLFSSSKKKTEAKITSAARSHPVDKLSPKVFPTKVGEKSTSAKSSVTVDQIQNQEAPLTKIEEKSASQAPWSKEDDDLFNSTIVKSSVTDESEDLQNQESAEGKSQSRAQRSEEDLFHSSSVKSPLSDTSNDQLQKQKYESNVQQRPFVFPELSEEESLFGCVTEKKIPKDNQGSSVGKKERQPMFPELSDDDSLFGSAVPETPPSAEPLKKSEGSTTETSVIQNSSPSLGSQEALVQKIVPSEDALFDSVKTQPVTNIKFNEEKEAGGESSVRKKTSVKEDNEAKKPNFVFPELSEEDSLFGLPSTSKTEVQHTNEKSDSLHTSNRKDEDFSKASSDGYLSAVRKESSKVEQGQSTKDNIGTKAHVPAKPQSNASKKNTSSVNLFDSLSDEEDDLFGGGSSNRHPDKSDNAKNGAIKKVVDTVQDLPSLDKTLRDKAPFEPVPKTSNPLQAVKLKPPTSLNVTKATELFDEAKDEPDGEVVKTAVPRKVGKLNIPNNLKINTAALLPGAKLAKSIPPEVTSAQSEEDIVKSPVDLSLPPAIEGVLTNAGKDRIKIQVKRRPQTRKARHEALRTSGIDFGTDQPESPSEKDSGSSSSLFQTVDSSPSPALTSNIYSPSTDGEDFINVPEIGDQSEKDDHIFSRDQTEPLLFSGAPVISPSESASFVEQPQKQAPVPDDLFNSSISSSVNIPRKDSTDDLFSSPMEASQKDSSPPNPLFLKVKPKVKPIVKPAAKSLFEDDDDDIDIFSGSVQPVKSEIKVDGNPERHPTEGETFLDPLGLLKGSD